MEVQMSLTAYTPVVQMIDIKIDCTFVGSSRARWKHGERWVLGKQSFAVHTVPKIEMVTWLPFFNVVVVRQLPKEL
jgi:hypothetical protein